MQIHVLVMMVSDLHGADVGADRLRVIEIRCEAARVKISQQSSKLHNAVGGLDPLPHVIAAPVTLKQADELRMLF